MGFRIIKDGVDISKVSPKVVEILSKNIQDSVVRNISISSSTTAPTGGNPGDIVITY